MHRAIFCLLISSLAVVLSRDGEFEGRQSYFVKADLSDAEEFKSEIVFLAAMLIKVYNETVAS